MKKIIIITASLLVSSSIFLAKADTKVYGEAHLSVSKAKHGSLNLENHDSLLGIKGANPLDNGLVATHQLEFGYDLADHNQKSLSARNTWVGIRGDFGEFRVGRQTTAYSAVDDSVDFLQRNGHGLHTFLQAPNTLSYLNKVDSFGFAVSTIIKGDDAFDGTANLLLNYKTYPFYAGIAYQSTPSGQGKDGMKLAIGHRDEDYAIGLVMEKEPKTGHKINTLSGKYLFDKIWLAAQYGKNKDLSIEQKNIELGYKLGKNTKSYYEWESLENKTSNRIGLVHKF